MRSRFLHNSFALSLAIGFLTSGDASAQASSHDRCALDRLPGPTRSRVFFATSSLHVPMLRAEFQPLDCVSAPDRAQIDVLPVLLLGSQRSGFAESANDGPLWAGKGLSWEAAAGVAARWKLLSAAVYPRYTAAANDSFRLRPQTDTAYSKYADPIYPRGIDAPRRFGAGSYARMDAGDSYARADMHGFGAGISNQNLWSGPGVGTALLLSNTAPGFAHAFIEYTGNIPYVGGIAANIIGGRLAESDYYDHKSANDHGAIGVMEVEIAPSFAQGLQLSGTRLTIQDGATKPGFFGAVTRPASSDNDIVEHSVAARFTAPGSRALFYVEVARATAPRSDSLFAWLDDQSAHGMLLGLQKTSGGTRAITVGAELSALQSFEYINEQRKQLAPTFYVDRGHGATHAGELLGAWGGPGSDSQLAYVEVASGMTRYGLHLQRLRRNESALYIHDYESHFLIYRHDMELTVGGEYGARFMGINATGTLDYTRRRNREFADDAHALQLMVRAEYTPSWRR